MASTVVHLQDKKSLEPVLIGVDWGSTNLRAFLIAEDGSVLDAISANRGMLSLKPEEFEGALLHYISQWLEKKSLPIIMSGMVGSRQGWSETDYIPCPADIDSLSDNLHWLQTNAKLDIAIIPGVKGLSISTQSDVMRGEEVQVFGALSLIQRSTDNYHQYFNRDDLVMCLPGTHSKWAIIKSYQSQLPQIFNFSTQMTGELYSLLDQHSILGRQTEGLHKNTHLSGAFTDGVAHARNEGGLLHHLFSARTHVLSGTLDESEVSNYLSGLLVGTEINEMLATLNQVDDVILIGNQQLNERYQLALKQVGVSAHNINGEDAACAGLFAIAKQAGLLAKEENIT